MADSSAHSKSMLNNLVQEKFEEWCDSFQYLEELAPFTIESLAVSSLSEKAKEHLQKCTLEQFENVAQEVDHVWPGPEYGGPTNMEEFSTKLVQLFEIY